MATSEDHNALQQRLTAVLTLPPNANEENAAINPQGFSVFDDAQMAKASNLASDFFEIANQNPSRPIAAVLDNVEQKLGDSVNDNNAIRHALMLFVTHNPVAQKANLKIAPLASRAPQVAIPLTTTTPAPDPNNDTEVALNYWREDINLNEHHEHWHIVYPGGGIPTPSNPRQRRGKDRQGELFIFMHQQMIARYNAERLVNGFDKVKAINDYHQPLEGDVPDANLRWQGKTFSARKNGLVMTDLGRKGQNGYLALSGLEQSRSRILEAIKGGKFRDGKPINLDSLGATLESNVSAPDSGYYGNLHNLGHVIIAYLPDPENYQNADVSPGLMYQTRTAVRDPIFWRWHSQIDDIAALWQESQSPNQFNDAPPVVIRKSLPSPSSFQSSDVIIVNRDVLEAAGVNIGDDAAVTAWGEKTFGGAKWDQPADPNFSTSVLETEMRSRNFTNIDDDGASETISYVFPREFVYFFKVENKSDQPQDVTLRVHLVPKRYSEERRQWFELDKFNVTIPPHSKKVVFRGSDQSSVIRKPAQKTLQEMDDRRDEDDGLDRSSDQYCDCGWPFNMIIPRGSPEGTPFYLAVLATDGKIDKVPQTKGCGSMSFCGAKDRYPDTREMGYPFNRSFPSGILKTIESVPTWAATDVTIKFQPQGFKTGSKAAVPVGQPASREIPINIPAVTSAMSSVAINEKGEEVTTKTEILSDGSRKVTTTVQKKVPKGSAPPWDTSKKGVIKKSVEIDPQTGRKVEITESIEEDGHRKILKKILPN